MEYGTFRLVRPFFRLQDESIKSSLPSAIPSVSWLQIFSASNGFGMIAMATTASMYQPGGWSLPLYSCVFSLVVLLAFWVRFVWHDRRYRYDSINLIASILFQQLVFVNAAFFWTIFHLARRALFSMINSVGGFARVGDILVISLILWYPLQKMLTKMRASTYLSMAIHTVGASVSVASAMFKYIRASIEMSTQALHSLSLCLTQISTFWSWYRAAESHLTYTKLGPDEFRLLVLPRWLPLSSMSVKTIVANFDTPPSFEAISYTWGLGSDTQQIVVDGMQAQISVATYNALRARWSPWRSRLIWIDYLCINQQDLEEKSLQVARMIEIYRKANSVVVHLGDAPVWHAFGIIHELNAWARSTASDKDNDSTVYQRYEWQRKSDRWAGFVQLFAHAWFTRVWVVQEVAVGRRVELLYGGVSYDWDDLMRMLVLFRGRKVSALLKDSDVGRWAYGNIERLWLIDRLRMSAVEGKRKAWEHDQLVNMLVLTTLPETSTKFQEYMYQRKSQQPPRHSCPLAVLLAEHLSCGATDPRDKIYALYNLSTDDISTRLIPNYGKPTEELYIDTARYFWSQRTPLTVTAFAGIGHERNLELPSWVPDWTCWPVGSLFTSPSDDEPMHKDNYRASGNSRPCTSFHQFDRDVVKVRMLNIDHVATLSSPYGRGSKPDDTITDYFGTSFNIGEWEFNCAWHQEALGLALDQVPEAEVQIRTDAFWRTLIGNRAHGKWPAPSELAENYRIWAESLRMVGVELEKVRRGLTLPTEDWFWRLVEHNLIWTELMEVGANGKRLCVTNRGHIGLVPPGTEIGDTVCIASGARTPWILRWIGKGQTLPIDQLEELLQYEYVGECYIHGMMNGEMLRDRASVVMEPWLV